MAKTRTTNKMGSYVVHTSLSAHPSSRPTGLETHDSVSWGSFDAHQDLVFDCVDIHAHFAAIVPHISGNLVKIAAFVMNIEIGLSVWQAVIVEQKYRRNVRVAHQTKSQGFDAVINMHPAAYAMLQV